MPECLNVRKRDAQRRQSAKQTMARTRRPRLVTRRLYGNISREVPTRKQREDTYYSIRQRACPEVNPIERLW